MVNISSDLLRRYPQAHKLPANVQERLIDGVITALNDDVRAVEKAIAILFARQTVDEQRTETTRHNNALGVRHNHGHRIAYYGKWLASGRHLSGKHVHVARKIALTYARTQLFELAALKAGFLDAALEREAIQAE